MLSVEEKQNAAELLQYLSWEDVQSLSRTVTKGLIVVDSLADAHASILQHTFSADELLSRQKITKEILFMYLHSKNISCDKQDKNSMKQMVLDLWKGERKPSGTNVNTFKTHKSQGEPSTTLHNELALKFSEWFYSLLNKSTANPEECPLSVQHFYPDCSIQMCLTSPASSVEEEVEKDAAGVVRLLIETKIRHNLHFNPNLTADGVHGTMDAHGLVVVGVCGTLHCEGTCVGVFEQMFGLARDPFSENNWKVKYTKMNLKSQNVVSGLPMLTDTELGRNLLSLPNSDTCVLPSQGYGGSSY